MKRIFSAIKITPSAELTDMISDLRKLLHADRIRWVDISGMHITLAFIGEVEDDVALQSAMLINDACDGYGSLELDIEGTGVFRSLRDPRVIWAGVRETEKLTDLAAKVRSALTINNIYKGDQAFRPHITLGRIKTVNDQAMLQKALEKYSGRHLQKALIKEVILYESILSPAGPEYRILSAAAL